MLLGPANSSIMVRHVLDVREGALTSNHTIPTLNEIPHLKYKQSKIKMLRVLQNTVPFFTVVIFSSRSWCSYFDTSDGYLRFIPTDGQTTVGYLFFFGS